MSLLREREIYPLQVRSTASWGLVFKRWLRFGREPGLSTRELASFTRQMSTLLEATIPYDMALRMIQAESGNPQLQTVLGDVRRRVVEGAFLSDALGAYPSYFPPILANMIRSGESGGPLPLILKRLADYYENASRLRGKLVSALVYPVFMMLFSTGVVVFMSVNIIPKITSLFENFGGRLPLPTRVLIFFSGVLIDYWWLILMAIPVVIIGAMRFLDSSAGRAFKDRTELSFPVLKTFRRKVLLQRIAETMSTMLKGGLELNDALVVAGDVIENRIFRRAIENVIFDIQNRGMQLSVSMRRTGLFPEDICQMVAIGEETATMEAMLENVSNRLTQELGTTLDSATALFEPVMILVMGVVVGFIVMSILLPMLQLNQLVGG